MSALGETRSIDAPHGGAGFQSSAAAFVAAAGRAAAWAVTRLAVVARTIESRRVMTDLAALEDHMLKDIGITRADVRDAVSAPLGADPTRVLVLRATERRAARRLLCRELGQG
ncbi:DUF1127 domain-containing protein [Xanthobacter sediminis]|uniref:DUF1127 domain-containing protein n=1 Tax=Xanthobacter sediminis TaxID=3119926 RepID=UPI003728CDE5